VFGLEAQIATFTARAADTRAKPGLDGGGSRP